MRRALSTLLAALLTLPLIAACADDGGTDAVATDRFPDLVVAPNEAAMVGRVIHPDGSPHVGLEVAACSLVDCLFVKADAQGRFIHNGLDPALPRWFEVFGIDRPSIVFRREFVAGKAEDVGDVVVPDLAGPPVEWKKADGGTVLLAGGRLELTAAPDTLKYPLGTVEFMVQAGPFTAAQLPPFNEKPWIGKEAGTIGFGLLPFKLHAEAPVTARLLAGVTAAEGAVYDVYHVDPLDGLLTLAGTATADANGVIETDPTCDLHDLTFILFVPQG